MIQTTNTTYTFLVSGGFAVAAYLIGGFDNLILSLAIMMIADFVSGLMIAAKNGYEQSARFKLTGLKEAHQVGISSKKAFAGLMKKAAMILAIVVAVRLDMMMGNTGAFMRNALIMGFIGMEGISFFENLDKLGVKLPEAFKKTFAQITQEQESPFREKESKPEQMTEVDIEHVEVLIPIEEEEKDGESK